MKHNRKIQELVQNGVENEIVDFKIKYYHKAKKYDLIKDLISFANNLNFLDKYIIFGISDENRDVIGIDESSIPDISDINQLIKEYCDPFINIEVVKCNIDYKMLAAIVISANNRQQPYTVAKDFQSNGGCHLRAGDIYVRKSANNFKALRNDIEEIYKKRLVVEINFDSSIFFRTIEIERVKNTLCCIPICFINDTENSFVLDTIKIRWIYSDSNIQSDVEYVEDDKIKFNYKPLTIKQQPFLLGAKTQYKKVLYFSVSDYLMKIIKIRQKAQHNLKIQISMYDAKKIEFKSIFDVDTIQFN